MIKLANPDSDLILVVGVRGSGKSHFVVNYLLPQYNREIIYDPMLQYPGLLFDDLNKLIDYVDNRKFYRVRYQDGHQFDGLCQVAYNYPGTCFVVEEANRHVRSRRIMSVGMEDLVFTGRHVSNKLILVCQRFNNINIDARSQFSKIYAFQQLSKRDIIGLEDVTGEDMSEIRHLPVGTCFEITSRSCKLKKLVDTKLLNA